MEKKSTSENGISGRAIAPALGLFGAAFLGAAGLLVSIATGGFGAVDRTEDWPSVEGEILSAELRTVHGTQRSMSPSDPGRVRTVTTTRPVFEYRYTVAGRTYHSDRLSIASFGDDREFLELFEAGDRVPVYYHPDKPGSSVLIHREKGAFLVHFLLLALLLGAAGLALCYAAWRLWRGPREVPEEEAASGA